MLGDDLFTNVEIEINTACNRACSYCPNSVFREKDNIEMDEALYTKIIQELSSLEFKGVLSFHFYNEPLLSSQLCHFVKLAHARLDPHTQLMLYTNGTLLTLSMTEKLIAAGISKIVVTKHENSDPWKFDETCVQLSDTQKEKIIIKSYKHISLTNRGGALERVGPTFSRDLPCYIPCRLLVVTVNGDVLPCFEDYHRKLVMGNVNQSSLIQIWRKDEYRQLRLDLSARKRSSYAPCSRCNNFQLVP